MPIVAELFVQINCWRNPHREIRSDPIRIPVPTMKPQRVFFDTNAFRYFGIAFESVTIAAELRDKILISPLSAFEVFAQTASRNL